MSGVTSYTSGTLICFNESNGGGASDLDGAFTMVSTNDNTVLGGYSRRQE